MGLGVNPQNAFMQKLLPILMQMKTGAMQGAQAGVGGGGGRLPMQDPTISPAQGPAMSGGGGGGGTSSTPVKPQPQSLGMPNAPQVQPSTPVSGLEDLLMNWKARRDQKKQAEASNAAQALMAAIDSGDKESALTILHENEKLFDKVYKGWLQKVEKQNAKPEKVDPEVQGVESGISKHVQSKQQNPNVMGGRFIPPGSAGQQLSNLKDKTELGAAQADPKRLLSSQLTSGEQRQAELGKAGLTTTPKIEAELKKYATELQIKQSEAQKAETELKIKESEAITAKEKAGISLDTERAKHQKALVDLDIARVHLQTALLKKATGSKTPPAGMTKQLEASTQAELYIQGMIDQGAKSFSSEDVQKLQALLTQAGASTLAKGLPSWFGSRWFSGEKDIQSLLGSIQSYKTSLSETLKNYGKPEAKAGADDEGGEEESTLGDTEEEGPMEGDIVDGYRFKGGDRGNQANWEKVPEKKP